MKNKHLILLAVAGALTGLQPEARAQSVILGDAASFAVLAGTGITFTAGATTITGDIGTYSTTTISGPGTYNFVTAGTDHGGDAFTQAAKTALTTAYGDAAGRSSPTTRGTELGGANLGPGVYTSAAGTFQITGNLTLNGGSNDVFIFQMASTLGTADLSQVLLTGGAQARNVFWQVGSSASLGITSIFEGNILALTSITLGAGSTVDGRLLAQNGAVTLGGSNTITVPTAVPEPATNALIAAVGALGFAIWRRRRPVGRAAIAGI